MPKGKSRVARVRASVLSGAEKPVEERNEYVVASARALMMDQVMFAPKAQPGRKPSAEVDRPVNLFHDDNVHGEGHKDSRADSQSKQHIREKGNGQAVDHKSGEKPTAACRQDSSVRLREAFRRRHGAIGGAGPESCLANAVGPVIEVLKSCIPTSANACLIDQDIASGTKSGYTFVWTGDGNTPSVGYTIMGTPVTVGGTGQRMFCSDQSSVIRFDPTGAGCTNASAPLE